MRLPQLALILAVAASLSAACAKAQARTEPVMPELAPPPPPERVVETYVDPVPSVAPGPIEAALATPPPSSPARPAPPRPEPPRPEPPRIEPEPPSQPTPTLTVGPTANAESKTVASIRMLMERARRDLGRLNFGALDADGKAQFGITQRFIEQADAALRAGNVSSAGKLADKAATMAALLIR